MPLEKPLSDYTPGKISSWNLQDIPAKSGNVVSCLYPLTKRKLITGYKEIIQVQARQGQRTLLLSM
jgi:hypothetical protein